MIRNEITDTKKRVIIFCTILRPMNESIVGTSNQHRLAIQSVFRFIGIIGCFGFRNVNCGIPLKLIRMLLVIPTSDLRFPISTTLSFLGEARYFKKFYPFVEVEGVVSCLGGLDLLVDYLP
jgi:hypothetical protein